MYSDILSSSTVVYPSRVSWRKPRNTLTKLLSPEEQKQPWRVYTSPGLVTAFLLGEVWGAIITLISRDISAEFGGETRYETFRIFQAFVDGPYSQHLGIVIKIAWELLGIVICESIDTVKVRLATQYLAIHQEETGDLSEVDRTEEAKDQDTVPRPAVHLPPCEIIAGRPQLPYEGVLDCVSKLYQKEGFASLLRGTFYTSMKVVFKYLI